MMPRLKRIKARPKSTLSLCFGRNSTITLLFLLLFSASFIICAVPEATADSNGSYSVIVLPDTQGYSESNPDIFYSQTEWIAKNKKKLNIRLVIHLGDVVEDPKDHEEWQRARKAINKLDGENIPTLFAFGNHDCVQLKGERSKNPFNRYFPIARYKTNGNYGGTYNDNSADNVFMTFERGNEKYLFLSVEYRPREEVLEWAGGVLKKYSDHKAVLVTHSYMWPNGYHTNTGDQVWDKLADRHPNVFMILCGHVPGSGVEIDYGENGNKVLEILTNYQYFSNGGNGFLRILTFSPGKQNIQVRTYSPYLDKYKKGPKNEFSFELK